MSFGQRQDLALTKRHVGSGNEIDEMNIRIPLCNVWHLNGNLENFSENLSEKDVLTEKKNSNTWETCYF